MRNEKNGGYILNHDIEGKLKAGAPRKMIVPQSLKSRTS
jgi:hypothetical protein